MTTLYPQFSTSPPHLPTNPPPIFRTCTSYTMPGAEILSRPILYFKDFVRILSLDLRSISLILISHDSGNHGYASLYSMTPIYYSHVIYLSFLYYNLDFFHYDVKSNRWFHFTETKARSRRKRNPMGLQPFISKSFHLLFARTMVVNWQVSTRMDTILDWPYGIGIRRRFLHKAR